MNLHDFLFGTADSEAFNSFFYDENPSTYDSFETFLETIVNIIETYAWDEDLEISVERDDSNIQLISYNIPEDKIILEWYIEQLKENISNLSPKHLNILYSYTIKDEIKKLGKIISLEELKHEAFEYKKAEGIKHSEALEIISKKYGYQHLYEAQKRLINNKKILISDFQWLNDWDEDTDIDFNTLKYQVDVKECESVCDVIKLYLHQALIFDFEVIDFDLQDNELMMWFPIFGMCVLSLDFGEFTIERGDYGFVVMLRSNFGLTAKDAQKIFDKAEELLTAKNLWKKDQYGNLYKSAKDFLMHRPGNDLADAMTSGACHGDNYEVVLKAMQEAMQDELNFESLSE